MKEVWAAPERNKGPILEVLARVFPSQGRVLEIASGSGQHAVHFAAALSNLTFMPTDVDAGNRASIAAWVEESKLPNLELPRALDVLSDDWGVGEVQAVFCANMIHIAPIACTHGLVAGVARHLAPLGRFVIYGPFRLGGTHTAPSNEAFDADLMRRNPEWGVRDAELVEGLLAERGIQLTERVAMPSNNYCLVFRRAG